MSRHLPAGVYLSARDCAIIDAMLVRTLRDLQLRNGAVPVDLVEVTAPIHQAAREFRANVLVETSSGTAHDSSGSVAGVSEATERLTVQEAARLTGWSTSYLRRLARRGDVSASRSGRMGEWVLDGGSLAARVAERSEIRKAG